MHSSQIFQALTLALTTFSVAHAYAEEPQGARIPQVPVHQMIKRQSASSGGSPQSSATAPAASTTAAQTKPAATTTPPAPTTPRQTTPPATTPAATTGPAPSTVPPETVPETTTPTPSTTESSVPMTTSMKTVTTVITTVGDDGQQTLKTSEVVTPTTVPSSSGKENKGMDEQTRNTVIGVVVGVGGAIALAVVGLVAWRIWGRKKQQEEVDNTFSGSSAYAVEKPEPTPGSTNSRTPFQSTLESYHAPTHVNTASNF